MSLKDSYYKNMIMKLIYTCVNDSTVYVPNIAQKPFNRRWI